MIRVMVVEDEPPIMRALSAVIQKANQQFQVVQTAINGQKALDVLKKEKIDVVFSDIRMPVMDGLELSEQIHTLYPQIEIVIVSGFSDFEYAKKAIEYQVSDYILKPISADKLKPILEKIQKEIQKRKHHDMQQILLSNEDKKHEGNEQYLLFDICAGAYNIYENDMLSQAMGLWNSISIDDFQREIVTLNQTGMNFPGKTMSERIVILEGAEKETAEETAKALQNYLKEKSEIATTIVYMAGIKINEIGKKLKRASTIIAKRAILSEFQIIDGDLTGTGIIPTQNYTSYIQKLVDYICAGKQEETKKLFGEIFTQMMQDHTTQENVLAFLEMVVNNSCLAVSADVLNQQRLKQEMYGAIANFSSYEQLAEEMTTILMQLKQQKETKVPKLIYEIEEYLKENYQKSITNTVLSREFGFVPSYISRLFRQHTNLSPGDYLTKLRIKKAKELMAKQPELMVKEIAAEVGFKDAYYFSKIFKKETGSWPTEFLK